MKRRSFLAMLGLAPAVAVAKPEETFTIVAGAPVFDPREQRQSCYIDFDQGALIWPDLSASQAQRQQHLAADLRNMRRRGLL